MQRSATIVVLSLACASSALAQQPHTEWFKGLSDLALYLKPRFNTPNSWDQQAGVRARLMKRGNFTADYSYAYDPVYPIKFNVRPKWTTGVQLSYFFAQGQVPIGVYTTPKYNMYNTWKQEFGLIGRLYTTKRVYVTSALDCQITYPYVQKSVPIWQASLTVGFPLGG